MTLIEISVAAFILILIIVIAAPKIEKSSRPHPRSIVSRTQGDMRSMATCIESYYADNDAYPAHATGAQAANADHPGHHAFYITTFRRKVGPDDSIYTLTTPIAYCTRYFSDPYAGDPGVTFGYYSTCQKQDKAPCAWIMWSPGPDKDYDIDPATDYNPTSHPSVLLIGKTYDPTNGTTSDGDIWRAKQ